MAAQRDLIGRSAPAQFPIGVARLITHDKGGFSEQVLAPDLHKGFIRQPFIKHHHCRLIAAKGLSAEGIDMPIGN